MSEKADARMAEVVADYVAQLETMDANLAVARAQVNAYSIRVAAMEERSADNGYRLVLEIEVPGFYVDASTQESADEWYDGKILPIVLNEWMREDVGLTFVSIPGEKEQNSDFEVHAMNGRIVGARIEEPRS